MLFEYACRQCMEGKAWTLAVQGLHIEIKGSKSGINIRSSPAPLPNKLDQLLMTVQMKDVVSLCCTTGNPDWKADLLPLLLSLLFIFRVDNCCDGTLVDGVVHLQQSGNESLCMVIFRDSFCVILLGISEWVFTFYCNPFIKLLLWHLHSMVHIISHFLYSLCLSFTFTVFSCCLCTIVTVRSCFTMLVVKMSLHQCHQDKIPMFLSHSLWLTGTDRRVCLGTAHPGPASLLQLSLEAGKLPAVMDVGE